MMWSELYALHLTHNTLRSRGQLPWSTQGPDPEPLECIWSRAVTSWETVALKGHPHRHGGDLRTPCRKALPTRDLNPGPSGCQEIMLTTMPLCCPNITHKDRFWCSIKRIRLISLGTGLIETVANRHYVSELLLLVVSVLRRPWLFFCVSP